MPSTGLEKKKEDLSPKEVDKSNAQCHRQPAYHNSWMTPQMNRAERMFSGVEFGRQALPLILI